MIVTLDYSGLSADPIYGAIMAVVGMAAPALIDGSCGAPSSDCALPQPRAAFPVSLCPAVPPITIDLLTRALFSAANQFSPAPPFPPQTPPPSSGPLSASQRMPRALSS